MWPDVTLLLREFARRPTADRPHRVDPGVDVARRDLGRSLQRPVGPTPFEGVRPRLTQSVRAR